MEKRLQILHLEDSTKDFELIHSVIESGCIKHKYFLADNEKDFITILDTQNIDIILADYNLPGYSGTEALKITKEKFAFIPFIFVSGTIGEDAAINAMLNGATDYVLKNKLERLVPAIKRAVKEREQLTQQKIIEKSFQDSEEKFGFIMDNSADAIFIANQQAQYIYTNKKVSALLGYTSEEIKRKTIADLTNPSKQEEIFKLFNQVLNEGKIYGEIELLKKDGNYISTDLNAVLLPDGMIYGSCRDITERKKAESELIKAKEKAEESDRLKSSFLANMSHEVRTPLNSIIGFSDLLGDPDFEEEQKKEFIHQIVTSGNNLITIISDIMDISKIESGEIIIHKHQIDVPKFMTDIRDQFASQVGLKNIEFKLTLPDTVEKIVLYTDTDRLGQVFNNLISNALKFTNKGCIEIGYQPFDSMVEFFVKDSGIGISEENQEMIFERFRQVEEAQTRTFGGNGLGLPISKNLVELMGGTIRVESEPGIGSTFYFTIPSEEEEKG